MSRALRQIVRQRAGRQCEYCRLPEWAVPSAPFHVEHIIAKQHRGSDGLENRCWSCHWCNLRKGPNLSGRDPLTDQIVRLYNPRRQKWERHFEWQGIFLCGRTRVGRATIAVLSINDPQRLELRHLLVAETDTSE